MASFGHSGSHTSQLMHSSVIISAMTYARSALLAAYLSDFRGEALGDVRGNELADIAAEDRNFAHQGRRNEQELLGRRKENRFDLGIQVAVHAGELELVLEVRHYAQAAHHDLGVVLAREIHEQPGEPHHGDVAVITQHALRKPTPSSTVKKRWFTPPFAT